MTGASGLISASIRPRHPDFLDLPWDRPLDDWRDLDRLEAMPRGESRNPVVFVSYGARVYALKSLAPGAAEREYDVLRELERRRIPAVEAVGHLEVETHRGRESVLCTRFLDHSIPYHSLFLEKGLESYRAHLLDALAGLLVQLHLAGVFWGDCSLFNALFLRDAGQLRAYLVDAETSEVHDRLEDRLRDYELDVMEENVGGALADLVALRALPENYPVFSVGADVRRRYDELWQEVSREVVLPSSDRYRIEERVRALNALGFSVGEIEIAPSGDTLELRVVVTDRSFHRDLLHSLTGLDVQEMQARQMINEIHQTRAWLSEANRRSTSLSGAAYHWLEAIFEPTVERLFSSVPEAIEPAELYCQLLEHKWYLSERAQRDVGRDAAVEDFLRWSGRAPEDDEEGDSGPLASRAADLETSDP